MKISKKATTIAIVNQKGGTGKTTTCENLGIGLAMEGKKVLLVPPFWLTMAIVVHFFAIKSPPRGAMRKVMFRSILID